jgi:hypothetical protein
MSDRRRLNIESGCRPYWPPDWYHDIRMTIGWELRARYEPPQTLPDLMLALLSQMDEQEKG